MKRSEQCRHCGSIIAKVRAPEHLGGRVFRWTTVGGTHFYCPQAGGDCWHEPILEYQKAEGWATLVEYTEK